MIAVLTADLIDSSSYDEALLTEVLNTLNEEFSLLNKSYGHEEIRWSIYRGDSFQAVINSPQLALQVTLQIKAAINRIHLKETKKSKTYSKIADFKIAIGIGTQDLERESIAESNGQAFQFSGRSLDDIKNENRKTSIKTSDDNLDDEFNTSFLLLDTITDKWSTASAEVVYYLLKGLKEREVADEIDISQSAVNQRKKAAGWEAISALLDRYNRVINNKYKSDK
jgi:DNA-directed RNA polymerase specialized sigma subunit